MVMVKFHLRSFVIWLPARYESPSRELLVEIWGNGG